MILDEIISDVRIDLSKLDTTASIYQTLVPLKKQEFPDSFRILFYHSSPLVHTYNDLPADSLITLPKMLVYIDIPNFVCMFASNETKFEQELNYVCEHYTVNETPINFICLE